MTSSPGHLTQRRLPPIAKITALALCFCVGTGRAADRADPLDTARLRPSAPSHLWDGPAAACPPAPIVPVPLRLSDSVDLALCNNPLTRESWANAKASAAALGIAQSAYLPNVTANVTLERSRFWNVPSAGG